MRTRNVDWLVKVGIGRKIILKLCQKNEVIFQKLVVVQQIKKLVACCDQEN